VIDQVISDAPTTAQARSSDRAAMIIPTSPRRWPVASSAAPSFQGSPPAAEPMPATFGTDPKVIWVKDLETHIATKAHKDIDKFGITRLPTHFQEVCRHQVEQVWSLLPPRVPVCGVNVSPCIAPFWLQAP
jgi:hypothetical protein